MYTLTSYEMKLGIEKGELISFLIYSKQQSNKSLNMTKRKIYVCASSMFIYILLVFIYDKHIFDSVLILQSRLRVYARGHDVDAIYSIDTILSDKDSAGNPKIILIWEAMFGSVLDDPHVCPGCLITYDKKAIERADAVIFHFAEARDSADWLPWKQRTKSQRWVWFCQEPPWNVRYVFQKTLTPLNGIFNWTMTYRSDSDILASYAIYHKPVSRSIAEMVEAKNASAVGAWLVSNCAASLRKDLIEELSKYIKIDIFGKCSGKPLCKGECQQKTLSRYKFYFAFENSQCKDYITEKFWRNALGSLTVPVVLGPNRRDYELVSPPNSFIHVDDFGSPKALAEYLQMLDKNDQLYGEYLRWASIKESGVDWTTDLSNIDALKKAGAHGLVQSKLSKHSSGFCAVCEKLKQESPQNREVVERLDHFWFGDDYDKSKESFSVCSSSTKSGAPLRWLITAGYTLFIWFLAGVLWYCCLATRTRRISR